MRELGGQPRTAEKFHTSTSARLERSGIGHSGAELQSRRLIKRHNFFVSPLMKRSLKVRISDEEFAHYTDVVPTPESRDGIAVFPVEIMRAHPWLGELESRVAETLAEKPVVLIFGRKDPALASDSVIERWRRQFPHATYIDLPTAGHYIQEDAPDEIIEAIRAAFG